MLSPISTNTPALNVSEPQAPATTRASTPPPQARTHSPPPRPHSAPPAPRPPLGQEARFTAQSALSVALEASREGNSLQALDTVLKHLPGASAREQKAAANEFIKHGLKREEEVVLPHLDHLYDALIGISKSDNKTSLALTDALFAYGLNKLPAGQHGAGLKKVSDALPSLSQRNGMLSGAVDLAANHTKLAEVHALTDSILARAKLMSEAEVLSDTEWSGIKANVINAIQLNAVAERAHDLAKVRQIPEERLIDAQAVSTLSALKDVQSNQAKLMLATNLLEQFDKIDVVDARQFLADLKVPLQALPDKDATAPLIAQINKRQQALGASDAATA
jgi:hypothetical protein